MDDNLPTFYINCYNYLQIVFCVQILCYYGSMQEPKVCKTERNSAAVIEGQVTVSIFRGKIYTVFP